jgi:hypothetical protein
MKALKPSAWLYYHTIEKYERFAGVVVPFLVGAGGYKLTKNMKNRKFRKDIDASTKEL